MSQSSTPPPPHSTPQIRASDFGVEFASNTSTTSGAALGYNSTGPSAWVNGVDGFNGVSGVNGVNGVHGFSGRARVAEPQPHALYSAGAPLEATEASGLRGDLGGRSTPARPPRSGGYGAT